MCAEIWVNFLSTNLERVHLGTAASATYHEKMNAAVSQATWRWPTLAWQWWRRSVALMRRLAIWCQQNGLEGCKRRCQAVSLHIDWVTSPGYWGRGAAQSTLKAGWFDLLRLHGGGKLIIWRINSLQRQNSWKLNTGVVETHSELKATLLQRGVMSHRALTFAVNLWYMSSCAASSGWS